MDYSRPIFNKLISDLKRKQFALIIGARQVGKTTVLKLVHKYLQNRGDYSFYITFENTEILNEINKHPDNIFKFIKQASNPMNQEGESARVYLLIDEIQYAKNPSNFLKYLYDTYQENLKIIATGSSAFYIDEKFNDSLAGRKNIFRLNTLDFDEFLHFKNRNDLVDEVTELTNRAEYISLKKHEIVQHIYEYMLYGGYPDVVLENDIEFKKERLYELRNAYLKRDILEAEVKNEGAFFKLFALLASQTGNLVNANELSHAIQVNNITANTYINALQKCFHITLVKPFYSNIKKELIKMPKVYLNDLGMRNALLNRFFPIDAREDKGALFENFIYRLLLKKYDEDNIKYWRTQDGKEVDFIVSNSFMEGEAIEVKWNLHQFKISKYEKFKTAYPTYKIKCITRDPLNVFNY